MCGKISNRTDSICAPLEKNSRQQQQQQSSAQPVQDSFYNDGNQMMASMFERLDNINGISFATTEATNNTTSNTTSTTARENPNDSCKLRGGGNLDGAVCLDCSKKCCAARMEKRDCGEQKKEIVCEIKEDKCKGNNTSGLRIECVEKQPSPVANKNNNNNQCNNNNNNKNKDKDKQCKDNMDYCDQHLSYLDRVMKSLDLRQDSCEKMNKQKAAMERAMKDCRRQHEEKENCRELEVVSARKAKSMVTSNCCDGSDEFGPKISNVGSCCNNNNDDFGTKAMSVCSGFGKEGDLRRAQSQMSSHSEYNFVNGYLPLKSTHNEISWHSVKLRKQVQKNFQIKNTSTKRLIIRVILDGPGFNFENPEANARGTITLQPNEVRTLMLMFNPTVLGPAIGNLIFQPPIEYCAAGGGCATMSTINSQVTKRVVRLYGYGGHVSMSFERLQQGPVGTKFLPLGNLCNLSKVFDEVFIIRNKGNLTGFAAVMLENKTVGKSMFDHAIKVCPDKVLIPPNSAVKVKVSFQPTGNDMREMMKIHRNQEVITVGNILVVTGDEPTRCRMKRLIGASKELSAKYSTKQLMNLWADYGTKDCDYDLSELRETGVSGTGGCGL